MWKYLLVFLTFVGRLESRTISRIVNGSEISINKAPYMVALLEHRSHFCGGSIIGKSWILTAAHCAHGFGKIAIRYNSTYSDEGGTVIRVSKKILHPKYNSYSLDYDVALLKLKKPINDENFYAKMANEDDEIKGGELVKAFGWGLQSNHPDDYDNKLRSVDLYAMSTDDCAKIYRSNTITENMVCAADFENFRDTCNGDSGGPLMLEDKIVGITSFGKLCADKKYPGVYSKVSKFYNWIKETTDI